MLCLKSQKGFAVFYLTMLVMAVALGLTASVFALSASQQKIAQDAVRSSQAYYAAEAGAEDAIYRIKKMLDIPSEYSINVGQDIVNISVDSPNSNRRVVTAIASVNGAVRKTQITLSISAVNPEFFYGTQAGTLGVEMENNSRIEGIGGSAGNIYSNGSIFGAQGVVITGDAFVATGMLQDQTHTVYNSGQVFGQTNPVIDMAQSFKPSISEKLVKASVYIKKIGSPSNRTIRIMTDSAGSPSKAQLASATLSGSLVGTSYGWVDVVFPSPSSLVQDTVYWLVFDAAQDNNDYWSWGKDNEQGYGNGQAKYTQNWNSASPVWTTIAGDLDFKIFMGGQATSLNDVLVKGNASANTINNSKICGDAYYQTIDSGSLSFLNSPSSPCSSPLTPGTAHPASPDPPLQNMPLSDSNINQWEDDAEKGGVLSGDLVVAVSMSYGPKKIEGNLTVDGSKTLTLTGAIYVTGNINIGNGASVRCDASYGANSCILIADGWIHIENNGIFSGSGQAGSYVMLLSNSICDGSFPTGCTNHNAAIDLHNNAAGAVFYAGNGLIYLHNGVEVSELTGKKLHLENNAIVRYAQGLASANFSSGPGASWQIEDWQEIE